eukprot:COSAG01_NODE_1437_length_10311_cov_11.678613_11_plen_97_part_00
MVIALTLVDLSSPRKLILTPCAFPRKEPWLIKLPKMSRTSSSFLKTGDPVMVLAAWPSKNARGVARVCHGFVSTTQVGRRRCQLSGASVERGVGVS